MKYIKLSALIFLVCVFGALQAKSAEISGRKVDKEAQFKISVSDVLRFKKVIES